MSDLSLSNLNISQAAIKQQLVEELSKTSWAPIVNSPFASTLLSLISSIGALDQAAILRARQESFRDTALAASSIYALADAAGVRLKRKRPGKCTALITSEDSSTLIPAYYSFESNGVYYFTREAVGLPQGVPTTVTLYCGKVISDTLSTGGGDYLSYVAPESGFVVSDEDTNVFVNGTLLEKTTAGIWLMENTAAYEDRTLPDGSLHILFGNATCGYRATNGDILTIRYVTCRGLLDNTSDTIGQIVTSVATSSINGQITTAVSEGFNEPSPLEYKSLNFSNFGTDYSSTTLDQHVSLALQFNGVIDASFISQNEVDPRNWMRQGILTVYPLGDSSFNTYQKQVFLNYLSKYSEYGSMIALESPLATPITVNVDVYCHPWATLTVVEAEVRAKIEAIFEPRRGILGYDIFPADIVSSIYTVQGVSYCLLNSPSAPVISSTRNVATPTFTITGSGTLSPGVYSYGVAVDAGRGLTTVINWLVVEVENANSSVNLTWDPIPGAIRYVVYGRTLDSEGFLADTAANVTGFTDTGTITPGSAPSQQNVVGVRYPQLSNLVVSTKYGARS